MRGVFLMLLVVVAAIAPIASAHQAQDSGIENSVDISACEGIADYEKRVSCYSSLCEPSYPCAQSIIEAAVWHGGAEFGINSLSDLFSSGEFSIASDGHELAHVVGRLTAKRDGLNGAAFMSCPSGFNYGCQHGFFEYALANTTATTDAATLICESLPSSLPPKDKFYCYHGVGHGVMMASAYNLFEALEACDSLPAMRAQEGCWQGVFMENINGEMFGEAKKSIFSEQNPLEPCSSLDKKYQWQCYINHAAYLVKFHGGSLREASNACLKADEDVMAACLESLGLMVTNPGWQKVLSGQAQPDFIPTAVRLCSDFPDRHREQCIFGAIDNLLNFDALDLARASQFCNLLGRDEKIKCYGRISLSLNSLATSPTDKETACSKVPEDFRQICLGNLEVKVPEQKRKLLLTHSLDFSQIKKAIAAAFGKFSSKAADSVLPAVVEPDPRLLSDDDFTRGAVKRYGLAPVATALRLESEKQGIQCHNRAHELGRMAYEIIGERSFRECGMECHSGCRHGATEAFFADKGTANLAENLNLLCSGEYDSFNAHQCLHGVGHGLMAWTNYLLFDALHACDELGNSSSRSSCYTGVFMENIVGGLSQEDGHFTEYLSPDPQYPCSIVPEQYKSECYFLQTDRMLQLTGNFSGVAWECAKSPAQFHRSCFESMGRTVSGWFARDAENSIAACRIVPDAAEADYCIVGALHDQFWDESQADGAIIFCGILEGTGLEHDCYNEIIQRSTSVIADSRNRAKFCGRLPLEYRKSCLSEQPQLPEPGNEKQAAAKKEGEQMQAAVGAGSAVIRFNGTAYNPREVAVKIGSAVVFVNGGTEPFWPASNIHPAHEIYPEFDAKKPISAGKNWSFTFEKQGIWRFHDHWNPRATGTVVVEWP